MRNVWIAALGCLLASCAHPVTSVRSSWHVLEESGHSATYLAILNQSNGPITVTEVIVNPVRDRMFSSDFHSGFHLRLGKGERIDSGRLLYLQAERLLQGNTSFGPCMIPIEVNLRLAGRSGVVVSKLDVATPNTVPQHWETRCGLRAAASENGRGARPAD